MKSHFISFKKVSGSLEELKVVQDLYQETPQYFLNCEGKLPVCNQAELDYKSLPPSTDFSQKYFYLIADHNAPIGVVDVIRGFPSQEKAMIGLFLLKESLQHQGLGTLVFSLLENLISEWREITALRIGVVRNNGKVIPFWKKTGFLETGEVKLWETDTMKSEVIVFEKELKPKLGSRTSLPFWDDEHISKQMLNCHLSFENDLASRKLETIQKTVEAIIKETGLKQGAKVLDLGCGPGLYTEEFSKRGFEVTGIDFSKRSIAYAKESAEAKKIPITYYCQDYLNLDFDNEFDLIIMIYLDYGALTVHERNTLNPKIVKALKDKAYFIFDVYSEEHFKTLTNASFVSDYPQGGFWSEKPYSLKKDIFLYPEASADLTRYQVRHHDDVKTYQIWNHSFSLEALRNVFLPWGKVNKINFTLSSDRENEETFFVRFDKEL